MANQVFYEVRDAKYDLVLVAPLAIIAKLFNLRDAAVRRVEIGCHDAHGKSPVDLWFGINQPFGFNMIYVGWPKAMEEAYEVPKERGL